LGTASVCDYDPSDLAKNKWLVTSGWVDPSPVAFGNAQRNEPDIRGLPTFQEDVRITKVTGIYQERVRSEFESEFSNITKRHGWRDKMNTNLSSATSAQDVRPRSKGKADSIWHATGLVSFTT